MRSFASDNNSSVHPKILDAIVAANADHAVGYGDDPYTVQALELLRKEFGPAADPYIVLNGTGANCVALQACVRSFEAVITASTAHISVDECGAPTKMTGARIFEIPTSDGKLTPELLATRIIGVGVPHHSQPRVAYISQCTELGTIYKIEEIRALADFLHSKNMYLHMDGARLANACAAVGCTLREMTVDAGVDILSFGGTKNGMMMGEAVISFCAQLSENLHYIRKQSAQLASKMRYLSAQFIPYLTDNLWRSNAIHANLYARKLAAILAMRDDVTITQSVDSNAVFAILPKSFTERLREHYFFYTWDESRSEVRFVTSWDTTDYDLEKFAALLK